MGIGGMADFASDWMGQGVPTKVYETKPVYLINNPLIDRSKISTSTTSFRQEGSRWSINFNWMEGGDTQAEGLLFEDIRQAKDYTSIAFSSKNQRISPSFDRQKLNADLQRAVEIAVPAFNFLLYRVESLPSSAVGLGQLWIYNLIISNFIDPANFDPEEKCDPQKVSNFIHIYEGLVIASQAEMLTPILIGPGTAIGATKNLLQYFGSNALTAIGPAASRVASVATGKTLAFFTKFSSVVNFIDPIQMAKQLYATRGQRYVSYCKDDEYKVSAWQKLSAEQKKGLTQTVQQAGIDKLTQGLNIGQLLGGIGQKIQQAQLTDVLSFRALYHPDGVSSLSSPSLIYLHLDGGTMQWHSVYAQAQGCFKNNLQSKDGATVFSLDANGVRKTVNGTAVMNLTGSDWKDRSLFSQRMPGNAMTLVPNKIITTQLNCGRSPVMEVDSKGTLTASAGCAGTACLVAGVLDSSGYPDFATAIGAVSRIETEKGTLSIANGFIYYSSSSGDDANKETRIPSVEAQDAGIKEGGRIVIGGDGKVTATGYTTDKKGEIDAGTLHAILAEKARIEFEPSTGVLRAAVYSMAMMLSNGVLGFNARPATNQDAAGRAVPAIRVDGVTGKVGFEENATQFNNALAKIQGATGGLQMLETANYTYFFTTDAQGNPVLKIFNKKTGETREIPITGTITRDAAGNLVVPTKEGNFQFKMDMQDGKPTITVNGPGIAELATLLAARGSNGIMAYNPATGTWELYNGQDVPWNRDFATNGLSVFGSADGTKGIAQASLFAPPARTGAGYEANPLAAMPAWPEGTAFVAMVGAIAAGAALIRLKRG